MTPDKERSSQGRFDIGAYMPTSDLPPLVAPQAAEVAPEAPYVDAVQEAYPLPATERRQTYIPASVDAVEAWRAQRRHESAMRQPVTPPQGHRAPSGFFVPPALMPPQERLGLPSAPTAPRPERPQQVRTLPVGQLPAGPSARVPKEIAAAQKDTQKPARLVERIKKHKRASVAMAAGAALVLGYGASHGSALISGESATAAAMEAEYPVVRNEAINCAAPALTMAFSGSTKARLPVSLKEAGHKGTYLEFDVSGLASTVANICAVRKNNAGQVLATYNTDTNGYTFDRSKIQLNTNESLINTNNINVVFTGEYVDDKPLTQADVAKYPFDDATNKLLVDLLAVKQDPKTKANVLTPTPQLSRIIRLKMEQLGLAVLQNPTTCANTQDAADQAVNNYVKGQLSRKTPATSKARQVSITGSLKYGDLTTAFRADKNTAAALDSTIVSLGDLTLNSCDAAPPQASASPTPTSKKG